MTESGTGTPRPFLRRGRDGRPDLEPGRRLFIAVPVAATVSEMVEDLVGRIRVAEGEGGPGDGSPGPGRQPHRVRWVNLHDLHLTIRFLGPTLDDRIEALHDVVEGAAAGIPAFSLGVGGAGAFPNLDRPRALWMGVADPGGQLHALAAATNRELEAAGWSGDDRPYNPHLTLARSDGVRSAPRVGRRLVEAASAIEVWFEVDRLVLFESHTGGGPARYVPLHEARLRG